MDRVTNPYSPGAGASPPYLAGRDDELKHFEAVLNASSQGRAEQSLAYTGLRGVGKTVLLNELRRRTLDYGWVAAKGAEGSKGRGLVERLVPALTKETAKLSQRGAHAYVGRALGVLRAFSITFKLPPVEVTLKIPAVADSASSGILEQDLTDVFEAVGLAAKALGAGVAIFIDELQDLQESDLAALIMATHHCNQEALPVLLVGAGLPNLPVVLSEAKSYAERLFAFREIGALTSLQTQDALVLPAAEQGVDFEAGAKNVLVSFSRGYPYFLQIAGSETWDSSLGSPISTAEAHLGVERAQHALDAGFYRSRFDKATSQEQSYLRAMAQLMDGVDSVSSSAVALQAGFATVQAASAVRAELIRKGLVHSARHGQMAFTAPLFDEYVRRREKELHEVSDDGLENA